MGYVSDVSVLVTTRDVEAFLTFFRRYGEPFGAVMNTEKTHIMNTTTRMSVISRLHNSCLSTEWAVGKSLNRAVESFSRMKKK